MIRAKLEMNTVNIRLDDGKHYCTYCGKEIKPDTEIDHHVETEYYHCDCKDALEEIRICKEIAEHERQIGRLRNEFPVPRYQGVIKKVIEKI